MSQVEKMRGALHARVELAQGDAERRAVQEAFEGGKATAALAGQLDQAQTPNPKL